MISPTRNTIWPAKFRSSFKHDLTSGKHDLRHLNLNVNMISPAKLRSSSKNDLTCEKRDLTWTSARSHPQIFGWIISMIPPVENTISPEPQHDITYKFSVKFQTRPHQRKTRSYLNLNTISPANSRSTFKQDLDSDKHDLTWTFTRPHLRIFG